MRLSCQGDSEKLVVIARPDFIENSSLEQKFDVFNYKPVLISSCSM